MSEKSDLKDLKINNPQVAFEEPGNIVDDATLSHNQKKRALETLEQDAHQLLTANNEGMAPLDDQTSQDEVQLENVGIAQADIGEKPQHKPSQ